MQPGALFFTEWRDETDYPDCVGPSVTFDGSGRITVGGKLLATVSTAGWIHVRIEAPLGKGGPRKFRLTVTPPGGRPQVFADLPFAGRGFAELHWLGFVSTAAADTAFYLDNLQVQRVKR